nr:hypothetical protein [Tanacetum cinerariifolium]
MEVRLFASWWGNSLRLQPWQTRSSPALCILINKTRVPLLLHQISYFSIQQSIFNCRNAKLPKKVGRALDSQTHTKVKSLTDLQNKVILLDSDDEEEMQVPEYYGCYGSSILSEKCSC